MIELVSTHRLVFPTGPELRVRASRSKLRPSRTRELTIYSGLFADSIPLDCLSNPSGNLVAFIDGGSLPQYISGGEGNFEIVLSDDRWTLRFNRTRFFPIADSALSSANVVVKTYSDLDEFGCVKIQLPQSLAVQGAFSDDSALSRVCAASGFNISLSLCSSAKHGFVRIGPSQADFWYYPNPAFFGTDSFSYRVINSLGQQSPEACVFVELY